MCHIRRLNPFHAGGLFLYLLKTSKDLWFSDVFGGGEGGMKRFKDGKAMYGVYRKSSSKTLGRIDIVFNITFYIFLFQNYFRGPRKSTKPVIESK